MANRLTSSNIIILDKPDYLREKINNCTKSEVPLVAENSIRKSPETSELPLKILDAAILNPTQFIEKVKNGDPNASIAGFFYYDPVCLSGEMLFQMTRR